MAISINKNYIIPSIAFMCVIILLIVGPIPQDQNYHNFADRRTILGIPNFLNVITNLPFFFVAVLGILKAKKLKEKELKQIIFTLFTGFLLVTFGSGYYHWFPQNVTLVYDRIPIVIVLMSFFAFIIYDSISKTSGYKAFLLLNLFGVSTVIYWILTEFSGNGDLRWYGMVQFFPVIGIPLILLMYPTSFINWRGIILIFIFFGIAKLAEMFDKQIYDFLHLIISGHSLKHLFMVTAEYQILRLVPFQASVGSSAMKLYEKRLF